jgi:hypothetical protein
MQPLALAWGITSLLLMVVGLIPCLGALVSWFNLLFSLIGIFVGLFALASDNPRGNGNGAALAGMVACGIVFLFVIIRLVFGAGVI